MADLALSAEEVAAMDAAWLTLQEAGVDAVLTKKDCFKIGWVNAAHLDQRQKQRLTGGA